MIRPGEEVVKKLGGLHTFTGWEKPILTDSGGFQIFSLAQLTKITEEGRFSFPYRRRPLSPDPGTRGSDSGGPRFRHCDGSDHVVGLPNERKVIEDAMHRSVRWAKRCRDAPLSHTVRHRARGLEHDLRKITPSSCGAHFDGCAIGGLSVGETPKRCIRLPRRVLRSFENKPRYLMGSAAKIFRGSGASRHVRRVMPTRNGRNAMAFTNQGRAAPERPLRTRSRPWMKGVLPGPSKVARLPSSSLRDEMPVRSF